MAAYPFRKMTTQQLRKLLQDEREQNRLLKESPDGLVKDPPAIQAFRINPISRQPAKIPTDSR